MGKEKRGQVLRGAAVLAAGALLVKAAGALFKIPLKVAIGAYGMGLFNTAYSFYGPIFSLATVGFPVAVSRMTSEYRALGRWQDARQVKRVALGLYLALGTAGMLALTLLAPWYCDRVLGNPQALAPILALAPALLFASVGAVYRGTAEGRGAMAPTAASQVVEALCKLGIGLTAARLAVPWSLEEYRRTGTVWGLPAAGPEEAGLLAAAFGAAGAILGVTAGTLAGAVFLAGVSGLRRREDHPAGPAPCSPGQTARRLLKITAPVAAGAVASNLAGLLDATILQSRMSQLLARSPGLLETLPQEFAGRPREGATFLVGCYTLAMTVYLLAPALTQTLGVSALPRVTAAWAKGDREALSRGLAAVCRGAALVCFPAGLGMAALALPISQVLFGADAAAPVTAQVLEILGLAALGTGLTVPLNSVLQGVGRADLPVKLLGAALLLKTAATWGLSGVPGLGLRGAAWSSVGCYTLLAGAELLAVRRVTGVSLPWGRLLGAPLAGAALCGLAARTVFSLLEGSQGPLPALVLAVGGGAGVYALGMALLLPVKSPKKPSKPPKTGNHFVKNGKNPPEGALRVKKNGKSLEKWG